MMVLVHTDVLLVLLLSGLSITVLSFVFSANAPFCLRSRGLGAELSKLLLVVEDQDHSQRRPHSKLYFRALKAIRHHPQNSEEEDESGRNSAGFTESMACPTEYHQVADIQDVRYKAADNFNGSYEFKLKKQETKNGEKLREEEASRIVKQQKLTRGDAKAEVEWHARYEAGETERAVCKAEKKARPKAWTVQPEKVGTEERKATSIGKANASSSLREKSKKTVADAFLNAEKCQNSDMDESSWNHSVGKELEQLIAKERGLAAERGFIEL